MATFSDVNVLNRFLNKNDLNESTFVFAYETTKLKKTYYKVVSGIYDTANEAQRKLLSLPQSIMINKPYVISINEVQTLYNKNNL